MTFEVTSIRFLTDKEAALRSPDFVGPDLSVRLRLSTSDQGIEFYSWKRSAIPAGYKVQRKDDLTVWLYGSSDRGKRTSSPGLKEVLFGSVGEWITLPAHSAIEWEELDSTSFQREKHAFTVFVRERSQSQPVEIISDEFLIPNDRKSPTH